jgi:hypothetical protein
VTNSTLVESYEVRRRPTDNERSFDPIDALRYPIAEVGHSQAEPAKILGSARAC